MTVQHDLVVFSHLRWTFVWQRPQHLISRLGAGRRVWFVEEPVLADVPAPSLRTERCGPVTRVWYEIPPRPGQSDQWAISFDAAGAERYPAEVAALLADRGPALVWLYTPLALPFAQRLERSALVYDVMDDLSAFAKARPGQREVQRRTLACADVVFAGGRSLYAGVRDAAPGRTFLFPSGVEPEHFAAASDDRRRHARPVAGYVGVIDERLDLELIADLAARLPDWDLRLVGPVVKIDPDTVPRAQNLQYPGMEPYDRLPAVMAGFDVALMPFARNAATRSISPTKTLEYLAAGLPVVSTRVPDVVSSFADVVDLQNDGAGFADACRAVVDDPLADRDARTAPLAARHEWDAIAAGMAALLDDPAGTGAPGGAEEPA
jgi:glycosyltransferase involved in cell wall biosynthesis